MIHLQQALIYHHDESEESDCQVTPSTIYSPPKTATTVCCFLRILSYLYGEKAVTMLKDGFEGTTRHASSYNRAVTRIQASKTLGRLSFRRCQHNA